MIERKLAEKLIRNRKFADFIMYYLHFPMLILYFIFCIIYILINKL
jgi:hypothetical protein